MMRGRTFVTLVVLALGAFVAYRFFARPAPPPSAPLLRPEKTITIIPGWNNKQVADYLVKQGVASTTEEVLALIGTRGQPASLAELTTSTRVLPLFADRPAKASLEGYLAPETYRIFADASLVSVIEKLLNQRNREVSLELQTPGGANKRTLFEIITMASIVEKEARQSETMAMVADIFWRRYDLNWALQSCATVNYITGKNSPAASSEDIKIDSPYNTYKYPGLPPGPISNPSLNAIKAVLKPTVNAYWYFMSDEDGVMHYAKTLEEHNRNVATYLR